MPHPIRFAFGLHAHQPVGNFDKVFHQATDDSYAPFLEMLEQFPEIGCSVHLSGCLLDWLLEHRKEVVESLRRLCARGQVEMIGSGYDEPILTMLPERDRLGQIRLYSEKLREVFGQTPRGSWLTERVWEQSLAKSLADAGLRYTVVDDYHFKSAGLAPGQLTGHFTTEDEGRTLSVFPIREELRYAIPWHEPKDTVEFLRRMAEGGAERVAVYADDLEKFGVWPKTKTHCFEKGWLRAWFEALGAERSWLKVTTLGEALDATPPAGRVYLPDASYREMGEWVLPPRALVEYEETVEALKLAGLADRVQRYMRGGTWRNFKTRYSEAQKMYAKMMEVSERVATSGDAAARRALYRGQCNCAYWHGVFGGLYLPHLRDAVYRNLIAADRATRKTGKVEVVERDLDFDLRNEVELSNGLLTLYFAPARGGRLYELDLVEKGFNLLDTLTRREEAYHRRLSQAVVVDEKTEVENIHTAVLAKEPGLEKLLARDPYDREALVDHFFGPDVRLEEFARADYDERGDFANGAFEHTGALEMIRRGAVKVRGRELPVELRKKVTLAPKARTLAVEVSLKNASESPLETVYGSEWNLNLLDGRSGDRPFLRDGAPIGPCGQTGVFPACRAFGVEDRWQKFRFSLAFSLPAEVWTFPVHTVSLSEGGFEQVYQASSITPRWPVSLAPRSTWTVSIECAVELL
jgi:alpha-amylase